VVSGQSCHRRFAYWPFFGGGGGGGGTFGLSVGFDGRTLSFPRSQRGVTGRGFGGGPDGLSLLITRLEVKDELIDGCQPLVLG
jgi:hypothetical protein